MPEYRHQPVTFPKTQIGDTWNWGPHYTPFQGMVRYLADRFNTLCALTPRERYSDRDRRGEREKKEMETDRKKLRYQV